jgi:hypothetical protein
VIKKIFSAIGLLTVALLLPAVGLSCSTDNVTASLGQEFTLPVGKTAAIGTAGLTIKFVEVTADSRCAKGVVCVWAGEAKCRMSITYKGSVSEVIFTQPGSSMGTQFLFSQYAVSFKLEPYPESDKPIGKSDYKLTMTVITLK